MKQFLSKKNIFIASGLITLAVDQLTKFFVSAIAVSDPATESYHIISLFEKMIGSAGIHFFFINVRHYFEMHQLFIRMILLPCIGIYIAYYLISKRISKISVYYAMGLLIGALLGNAVDIIFRGYVVDWIGYSSFAGEYELNFAINYADIAALVSFPIVLVGLRSVRTISLVEERQEESIISLAA
ncbi:signal peptidase II [bacterium]|nr:signal peptidase II [bacterium]MCP5463186.1 signal peptidase II [bacterium]